jgi:hypothetical protein
MAKKHILFFVHGMGEHDNTWHEEGLKVIRDSYNDYERFKDRSFDDYVEAVPIVYDDVFKTWRQRMKDDFTAFKAALTGSLATGESLPGELDKLGDWIGAGDDSFAWTHAMDVILYRSFSLISMAVNVSVCKQILERLQHGDYKTWSLLSHSLGTSVTHNALSILYDKHGPLGDGEVLDPAQTRPRTVMMVANVSRILQQGDSKVYESRVQPGSISAERLCGYYLNCRHKLDPFCSPRPFNPDNWPDPPTFNSDAYQHSQPGHLEELSESGVMKVHDFAHYLKNPRVHVPLYRSLFGRSRIPDSEFQQAKAQFDAAIWAPHLDAVRKELEHILPAAGAGMDEFVALFSKKLLGITS